MPKRPVVVAYSKMPEAFAEAERVVKYLKERGFDAPNGSIYDDDLRRRTKAGDFDVLIAMGGDGTMLRAGHLCAPSGVPILGIMMGRLGFLMQVQRGEWPQMLDRLFKGEGWVEHRMMLAAEHIRGGETLAKWQALNEVVVGRGQALRAVRLVASVDGRPLTTYVCDGLIASTATGSTARLPHSKAKASSVGSSAASMLKSRVPQRGLSVRAPGTGDGANVPASTTSRVEPNSRARTEIAAPPAAKLDIIAIVTACG